MVKFIVLVSIVDLSETYNESALKELREETGIIAVTDDLLFIRTEIKTSYDTVTGTTNHPRRNIYLYTPKIEINNLVTETGKALGFVSFPFTQLFALTEPEASNLYLPY